MQKQQTKTNKNENKNEMKIHLTMYRHGRKYGIFTVNQLIFRGGY